MEQSTQKISFVIARFVLTLVFAFLLMKFLLSFWPETTVSGRGFVGNMIEIYRFGKRTMLLIALAVMFSLLFSLISIALNRLLPSPKLSVFVNLLVFVASSIPAIFVGYLILALYRAIGKEAHFFYNPTGDDLFRVPFKYYLLPAFVLGISDGFLSELIMHLRQEFGSVLGERYVKHAKAMGLSPLSEAKRDLINRSWRVLFSRGTALLSGTIVVEQIFGVRGIGYLIFNAANYKHADSMFLILGCSVIFVIVINCVHYFLTLLIDPRLRES